MVLGGLTSCNVASLFIYAVSEYRFEIDGITGTIHSSIALLFWSIHDVVACKTFCDVEIFIHLILFGRRSKNTLFSVYLKKPKMSVGALPV